MKLTTCAPAELPAALERVFAGDGVVAPLPGAGSEPVLAVVRPDLPVEEVAAGVVVATSGSTGNPKAVVLSADAIAASARATHARLGGPGDWVCVLPTHHVAGLMTLARAVLAGRSVRFGAGDLSDLPSPAGRCYLSVVGAQLYRAVSDPALLARLREYAVVLVGGSAVSPLLLRQVREAGVTLVTTYGMAETCGGCVYDGLPLDGVRVGIEDGRVTLAGAMAFSGYRLDPGLTARVLRGDTVLTRDRGRLDGGRLEVTGRVDEVVVSGGVNVDLAEAQRVAEAVLGPPEAGGPVLLAVADQRWGHKVVAVTTGASGLDVVVDALRGRLGPAALPKELRRVASLAYTPTGKIDRRALARAWQRQGESDGDGR
ncbi:MAG: AMP-binding protein [Propionicimonas sp.]|nr:AMP-binding protein [Propionicimonas sp.]